MARTVNFLLLIVLYFERKVTFNAAVLAPVLAAVLNIAISGAIGTSAQADIGGRDEGDHQFMSLLTNSPVNNSSFASSFPREVEGFRPVLPGIEFSFLWQVENRGAQAATWGQIIWEFPRYSRLPLPPSPGGRSRIENIAWSSWSQLALYDVKLQVIFYRKDQPDKRYSLVLDLGIPNKPGEKKWSLSAPNKVSWDQLLTRYQGPGRDNSRYLSADEARELVGSAGQEIGTGEENSGVIENSWLLNAKISTVAYFDHLLVTRLDWQAELMVRTIKAQLDNLDKVARLPTGKIRQRLAQASSGITRKMDAVPEDLQRLFDKLNQGVPEKYLSPVRRAFYHAERKRIFEQALEEVTRLKPGRQLDDYPAWLDKKVKTLNFQ